MVRDAFFHQESKCRPEVTSAGIRASYSANSVSSSTTMSRRLVRSSQAGDIVQRLLVLGEEPVPGGPVPLHQGVPDEQFAGHAPGRSGRIARCAPANSVTPSSMTFSVASTLARLAFQRGSE